MCGRFVLGTSDLKAEYDLDKKHTIKPQFNIAPGSMIPVIIHENGQNVLKMMKWGFEYTNKEGKHVQIINARGETLPEKNFFKGLATKQRVLIPATGFYEWQKTEAGKIPYYIYLKERTMFSFGGFYRTEKTEDGREVEAVVIITTEPNSLMKEMHNRMPLILGKHNEEMWLSDMDLDKAMKLIRPYPPQEMDAFTISKRVNYPGNDDPSIIEHFSWDIGSQKS
jgi:putative SOS response-associated peptidase YedK